MTVNPEFAKVSQGNRRLRMTANPETAKVSPGKRGRRVTANPELAKVSQEKQIKKSRNSKLQIGCFVIP